MNTMPETIPDTMKALVAYGPNDYRLETNWPAPSCGPDDVIIKTEGCSICASDLKCAHGAPKYWGDENTPRVVEPPFVPGNEFIGRVAAVGENIRDWHTGDRVIPEQIVSCGHCRFCQTGRYWMCQTGKRVFGFYERRNGGMAEYVRLPQNTRIHRVPEDMPLERALLTEPYGCGKHCVDRAQIGCEDVVVISGAGAIGLAMVSYAKKKSPAKLVVMDIMDNRLELAKRYGADITLNPNKIDAVEEIKHMTDGYGCDIYIEAAGHPVSVQQGLAMVRKLGRFVEFGVFGEKTSVDWSVIGDVKELDILGSHLSPYCFPYIIDSLHSGALRSDGILRTLLPLEKWEEGFRLAAGTEGDLKVAFRF